MPVPPSASVAVPAPVAQLPLDITLTGALPHHDEALATPTTPATPATPTAMSHEVAGWFGLYLDGRAGSAEEDEAGRVLSEPIRLTLAPHRLVFITGPSGAGKSVLLRELRRRLRTDAPTLPVANACAGRTAPRGAPRPATLIDALAPLPRDLRLSLLAAAGLNDARVLLRPAHTLSAGQAHRFAVARAVAALHTVPDRVDSDPADDGANDDGPTGVLCIDEFGSNLDRSTAATLAASVRRLTRRLPLCAVLATAHDDLLEVLRPDTVIEQHLGGTATVHILTG